MKDKSLRPRVFVSLITLAITFALSHSIPSTHAQTKTPPPVSKSRELTQTDEAPIAMLPDKAKRYAVIIGVDKYTVDKNISALSGASNDAKAIADALVKYGGFLPENVILLNSNQEDPSRQPTRSAILGAMYRLKNYVEKDAMIVVAFSGHGMERETDHQAFLLPADAQASTEGIEDTAISVPRMKELIKQTGASQVMLILDACRNDPAAGGRGDVDNKLKDSDSYIKGFDFDRRNSGVRAFVTLYAASVGQRAWEDREKKQGYFSLAFVEGLKGGAANGSGEVTLGGLVSYLQSEVPKRVQRDLGKSKQQTPYPVMEGFANELVVSVTGAALKPVVVVPAIAQPTTGTLAVFSEPKALISVAPAAGGKGQSKNLTLAENQRLGSFDSLPPGRYLVTATLDGFATGKTEVEVVPGKPTSADLNLKAITYSVTIKTNVKSGKVTFGLKGDTSRIASINNGEVVLDSLRGGTYDLNITTDEVGYSPKSETINVADNKVLSYTLARPLASQPFDADFAPEQWDLPAKWSLSPRLHVNGEGVGLLKESASGRYADVKLISNIELINGSGVSFVMRAIDKQNYYLVRLTGPKADVPNKLRVYVVKDGKAQQIGSSISCAAFDLSEQFAFTIKLVGNRFDFTIEDSNPEDAELVPVGGIIDAGNTFTSGAMGVAGHAGEEAKILRLFLNPKP